VLNISCKSTSIETHYQLLTYIKTHHYALYIIELQIRKSSKAHQYQSGEHGRANNFSGTGRRRCGGTFVAGSSSGRVTVAAKGIAIPRSYFSRVSWSKSKDFKVGIGHRDAVGNVELVGGSAIHRVGQVLAGAAKVGAVDRDGMLQGARAGNAVLDAAQLRRRRAEQEHRQKQQHVGGVSEELHDHHHQIRL